LGVSDSKYSSVCSGGRDNDSIGSQMDSGEVMNPLLIALGAALGAPARYLIDKWIRKYTNVLGSFLIGLTVNANERWHNLLAVGFLGAFTTWSTFMLDLFFAYEAKRYKEVAVNLTASIILGSLAAWVGIHLAQ
jgi:CrcB protein